MRCSKVFGAPIFLVLYCEAMLVDDGGVLVEDEEEEEEEALEKWRLI